VHALAASAVRRSAINGAEGAGPIRFAEQRRGRENGVEREGTASAPREGDARENVGVGDSSMQERWWQLGWTAISIWACHQIKRSWATVMELWNIEKERD
jgi:hypothetical protein